MRVAYIVGARPNYVKMGPVIGAMRLKLGGASHVLIQTGQHYDRMLSEVFAQELGVPEPDYVLGVGSGTHATQTARAMERLELVIEAERPDLVIVPGDVNSTLAAALVCAKLNVPLAHVESGLRSFDRTMPEEINRILVDQLAEHLFVHSADAVVNLGAEGISDERVHFVGNTMIDSLVAVEDRYRERHAAKRLGVREGDFLLVTLHRPSLVDGALLRPALARLTEVARELPVVFREPRSTRARAR